MATIPVCHTRAYPGSLHGGLQCNDFCKLKLPVSQSTVSLAPYYRFTLKKAEEYRMP